MSIAGDYDWVNLAHENLIRGISEHESFYYFLSLFDTDYDY